MSAHHAHAIEAAASKVAALRIAVRVYRDFPAAAARVTDQLAAALAELDQLERNR